VDVVRISKSQGKFLDFYFVLVVGLLGNVLVGHAMRQALIAFRLLVLAGCVAFLPVS